MSVKDSLGYYNSPIPVGTVIAFAGVNPPYKWLLCDGAFFSLGVYPLLENILGTTFNTGVPNTAGTILVTDNSPNFTITSLTYDYGAVFAGLFISVDIGSGATTTIEILTYDPVTGNGTFNGSWTFPPTGLKSFVSNTTTTQGYLQLPDLVTQQRAVYGAAAPSSTIIPQGISAATLTIAASNLPSFNPTILSSNFSASLPQAAWDDPQVQDSSFPTGLNVATGFNYATTFSTTITSTQFTYLNTNPSGIATPVSCSFSNLGVINFNNLEMTYIIKAEY